MTYEYQNVIVENPQVVYLRRLK